MRVQKAADGRFILKLSEDQQVNGHRPSVDTMFESLLPFTSLQRHLVLLTGMGSDGARMMKNYTRLGSHQLLPKMKKRVLSMACRVQL